MKFDQSPKIVKNAVYDPIYTDQDAQQPIKSPRYAETESKYQTWDKIGALVLQDMKNGTFDEYCKQNNKNYYELKDKYTKLTAPLKRPSSSKKSSRRSSKIDLSSLETS